jgi:hyaluronoglucosaminidase
VRFGVGLSPFELYLEWDAAGRAALDEKLERLDAFGVQDLAILFDDMRGDVPELAELQAEIVAVARERTAADRVIVCPSYYSDDPILDRAFGQRPEGYLERLGELLDPSVEVYWTGEEVCAREFTPGHLEDVARRLGRKPFLWDNYPVNDGQRMSQYLHVRGFTGRGSGFADAISAHAINPALQPVLSRIPALTLVDAYRDGPRYRYGDSTTRACVEVLGEELGMMVRQDVLTVQDIGLDLLGAREKLLRERYTGVDHPGAREIIAWLDGAYRITDEIVHTQ